MYSVSVSFLPVRVFVLFIFKGDLLDFYYDLRSKAKMTPNLHLIESL